MTESDQTKIALKMITLAKGQSMLQSLKQVLVSHPLFHPLALFRYLSHGEASLTRKHIGQFLEENQQKGRDQELRSVFKDHYIYPEFLQYTYPYCSAVLRNVAAGIKYYPKLQKCSIAPDSVANFLLLVQEQIALANKILVQKHDTMLSEDKIKKIFKKISFDSQKIKANDLKIFLKKFVQIQDRQFLQLMRKLEMKYGVISLQKIQEMFKTSKNRQIETSPITKIQTKQSYNKQGIRKGGQIISQSTTIHPLQKSNLIKSFNERQYKEQLYHQLAATLNLNNEETYSFKPCLKESNNILRKSNIRQNNNNLNKPYIKQKKNCVIKINEKKNLVIQKQQWKKLFISYVQDMIRGQKTIEKICRKYNAQRWDLLKLFKNIDCDGKGVINADDIYNYYQNGKGNQLKKAAILLLIQKYSQNRDNWLSFSEFSNIFRSETEEQSEITIKKHFQVPFSQLEREIASQTVQIIEIIAETQFELLQNKKKFTNEAIAFIFASINQQKTGFINYQELKKWLTQTGLVLPMKHIMHFLKRIDKSKNGVVVQNQFQQHFCPSELYF